MINKIFQKVFGAGMVMVSFMLAMFTFMASDLVEKNFVTDQVLMFCFATSCILSSAGAIMMVPMDRDRQRKSLLLMVGILVLVVAIGLLQFLVGYLNAMLLEWAGLHDLRATIALCFVCAALFMMPFMYWAIRIRRKTGKHQRV